MHAIAVLDHAQVFIFLVFYALKTAKSRHSVNIVTWLCCINKLLYWNYSGKFKHFICMLTTLASFGLLTMTHQSMADYYGISVVTLKKYKRFDGYFTSHQLQSFLRNNTHKNSKHLKKSSCKSSYNLYILPVFWISDYTYFYIMLCKWLPISYILDHVS